MRWRHEHHVEDGAPARCATRPRRVRLRGAQYPPDATAEGRPGCRAALSHDRAADGPIFPEIGTNLRDYLAALCRGADDFHGLAAQGINLAFEPDDGAVVLGPEACMALGIVVNELVANAAVGFPPGSGGFCKEPEHPRRAPWRRSEPDGASRGSSRRRR